MKFVYDKELNTIVPDQYLYEIHATDLEKEVFAWLNEFPWIPKELGYSTRRIAYKYIEDHETGGQEDAHLVDQLRDAAAKWYNANSALAESAVRPDFTATEDGCGAAAPAGAAGIGPNTAGLSSGGPAISLPVLCEPKKKKKKNAKEDVEDGKQNDCFQSAWKVFYRHIKEKPLLCHGVVTGKGKLEGKKFVHAWVEVGDIVYDLTMPLTADGFPKEAYYSLGNIDKSLVFTYDARLVAKCAVDFGTYGPWEDILWQYS